MMERQLLVVGLGYVGRAVARRAVCAGWRVAATVRDPARSPPPPRGVSLLPFAAAEAGLAGASHLLLTAPPTAGGDPLLLAHGAAVARAIASGRLRWIGYVSSTGVYGDRGGAVVSETTPPTPQQERSRLRLAAEEAWRQASAGRVALDVMRAGGIYGPGRSPFADLRAGRVRRIIKPGHLFSRIHRDDIAHAVLAAMNQELPAAMRVLHLVDDEPAELAAVITYAAELLGLPPPPALPFEEARHLLSPMALSFYAEHRRLSNALTKAALGISWTYPTYREGLSATLAAEEGGESGPE